MPAQRLSALAAILLAFLLLASFGPASAAGPDSFAPMVKRVLPTVVNIAFTERVTDADDPFSFLPPELRSSFASASIRAGRRGRVPDRALSSIRRTTSSPTTMWSATPTRSPLVWPTAPNGRRA